jgi:hypothetical protein
LCTLRSYVRSGWIWGGEDKHKKGRRRSWWDGVSVFSKLYRSILKVLRKVRSWRSFLVDLQWQIISSTALPLLTQQLPSFIFYFF